MISRIQKIQRSLLRDYITLNYLNDETVLFQLHGLINYLNYLILVMQGRIREGAPVFVKANVLLENPSVINK